MKSVRLLVLSVGALCFPRPARPDNLAVVPLEASGPVAEVDLAAASDAIAAELRLSYDEVLLPADARAGIEARSPGCLAAPRSPCVAAALEAMGWPRFVTGRVNLRAGAAADLGLELFESATGRLLASASRSTTAADRAGLVALGRVLARDLGHAGDAAASRRELVLAAGRREQVNVAFAASGASPRGRPILGPLILGAVGVGLLAVDLVTVALEGCEGEGAAGTCRQLAPAPVAVYGISGVIALGSAVVWYLLGGGAD